MKKTIRKLALGLLSLALWPSVLEKPAVGQDLRSEVLRFSGRLESSDNQLDDGSYYDLYRFSGQAGDDMVIQMLSNDLDAYILLLDSSGTVILQNDDVSRGNTDAQMMFTLPASGEYAVAANSYGAGERGEYLLVIALEDILQTTSRNWPAITSNSMGAMFRAQQSFYLEENRFTDSMSELAVGLPDETDAYFYRFTHIDQSRMVQFVAQPKWPSLRTYMGVAYVSPNGGTTFIACQSDVDTMELPPGLRPGSSGHYVCPSGYSSIR